MPLCSSMRGRHAANDRRTGAGRRSVPTILGLAGEDPGLPKGSPAVDLSQPLFAPAAEMPPELRADRLLAFQCARMGYQTPQSHKDHVVTGFTDGRCRTSMSSMRARGGCFTI